MMIKAVLFDMDGVLVDSESKNIEQLVDFMKEYGVTATDQFMHSLIGTSYEYTNLRCIQYMKVNWSLSQFNERFEKYCKAHPIYYGDILNPSVKETLSWLKLNGYYTAIASSSLLKQIKTMLNECKLNNTFDIVLSGEMFNESKPNPEIYLTAASKLGVKPYECIVVEDSFYGILAGKNAGMKVIAYKDSQYQIDQSQADIIIHNIGEIKKYI